MLMVKTHEKLADKMQKRTVYLTKCVAEALLTSWFRGQTSTSTQSRKQNGYFRGNIFCYQRHLIAMFKHKIMALENKEHNGSSQN